MLRVIKASAVDFLSCAGIFAVMLGLMIAPEQSVAAAQNGVLLCLTSVIPSLFPFFVLSSVILNMGLAEKLGKLLSPVMRRLFGVSGVCASAFVLGLLGGYPVGARTISELYSSGKCSKEDAERALAFCSNTGPSFIFGAVGAGVFRSVKIGTILYISHFLSAAVTGILFRGRKKVLSDISKSETYDKTSPSFAVVFTEAVRSSVMSVLSVSGFVVFFTVLGELLKISGILNFLSSLAAPLTGDGTAESIVLGFFEFTTGIFSLSGLRHFTGAVPAAAFILGWSGLSVHAQTLSFTSPAGLKTGKYFLGKTVSAFIAAFLADKLTTMLNISVTVSADLIDQSPGALLLQYGVLSGLVIFSFAVSILIFLAADFIQKKVEKRQRERYNGKELT